MGDLSDELTTYRLLAEREQGGEATDIRDYATISKSETNLLSNASGLQMAYSY